MSLHIVIGAASSGKSSYAEELATSFKHPLVYIATLKPFVEEDYKRIENHKKLRKGKGFTTYEVYGLINQEIDELEDRVVLIECMSNIVANNLFSGDRRENNYYINAIADDIIKIKNRAKEVVLVTNDIVRESTDYGKDTTDYIEILSEINKILVTHASSFTEVVCGIDMRIK